MKRSTIVLILILIVGLLSPGAGKADRRVGFGTPDNFQIRAETHLKCRTRGYKYASGDIKDCFDAGLNDPYFKFVGKGRKYDLQMTNTPLDNLGQYDCVLIVTDHSDYDYQRIVKESQLVVDTRNATKGIRAQNVVRC